MERRRVLQTILLAFTILFLLVLALKFKPRIETPAPVPLPKPKGRGEGTLSALSFRYVQHTGDRTDFVVTADEVTEAPRGEKLLTRPVVVTPRAGGREDRAHGARGALDPSGKTFRIFEGAQLESGGWTCSSTGFRFTPEGEAVSEGGVVFSREQVRGSADLLTYHRTRRQAILEGSVKLGGTEGKSMACSKLFLDLEAHGGSMEGPLSFSSPEGTLTAPRGTIKLTEDNRLKSMVLEPPVRGQGPKGALESKTLLVEADASGKPARYIFSGSVRLLTAPPDPVRIETETVNLVPGLGGAWEWSAPAEMTLSGYGEVARAPRGEGKFGGGASPSAKLAAPVRGTGEQGDFAGDMALLRDGAWTLRGRASLCRAGDTLYAAAITWKPDGSGRAEGEVRGTRAPPEGRAPTEFEADLAKMSAGGYPIGLSGKASVTSGHMAIAAPKVDLLAADRALASEGVAVTLQDKGAGESRLHALAAGYEGAKGLAWAQGNARAEGRGYVLDAPRIEARLDGARRAERYEALGEARFSGTDYDGEGDRLTFTPATNSGEARREGRDALVIQKNPYRRLSAPVVRFAPSRVETSPGGEIARRGRLEGAAPKAAPPAPKPSPLGQDASPRRGGPHG